LRIFADFPHKSGVIVLNYFAGKYDICVIGAGHAGIEAALAAARLGAKVVCFTINLDAVGNMPCNPAIGGTAKGHLVREIDALGGEMAKAADETCFQYRMLNRGKGPAVYSLRAQADRRAYQARMKHALEHQENLALKQGEIVEILTEDGEVSGVVTRLGAIYQVRAVVICSGTYLRGNIIIGDTQYSGGPDGMFPADALTQSLKKLDLPLMRFKTGTPARVNRRSIDFSKMEPQPGDEDPVPFSFETDFPVENSAICYLTYSTEETHEIVRRNLHRSPLYSGKVEGVGPRYCPSFEDKVVRFSEKPRHQLFIEPIGRQTDEMYIQGMSSSMPEDVQLEMMRSVPGLEKVEVMRPAYAIEYDCIDPLALNASLMVKTVPGLFGAGQFNGSSGYEEAAAQGLIAGINAARFVQGKDAFSLDRSQSYIGTLIDDLVTKGTNEPYRMMTSRSEYRLILRQDNADIRLTPIGYELGLVSKERYEHTLEKYRHIDEELERIAHISISPSPALDTLLAEHSSTAAPRGINLKELCRRPEIGYAATAELDPDRPKLTVEETEQVEISVKYEGYISRQLKQVEKFRRMETRRLPTDLDYQSLHGLRTEAREKLDRIHPSNVGQASRISGVSPADIAALLVYLDGGKIND